MLALAYTRSRKNALKQYNEALFALSGVSNHNVAPRKGLTTFYIKTSSTCIMWLSLTDNISTSSLFECGRCPQARALTFTFYLWEGDLGFQTRIKLLQRSGKPNDITNVIFLILSAIINITSNASNSNA